MPFLIERPADSQPAAFRVEGDLLLIGRGTNAGLRLDGDAVALEHARIERDPAGYRLADLDSVTGTYRNGKPLTEPAYLKDGDVLGIGGWRLRVRSASDPLTLDVRPAVAETAASAQAPPEVDYAAAYTLRRPFLTKGFLALLLTLGAAAVLASLPVTGAWEAFQPGAVSKAHQQKKVGCADCHVPWRGPQATACGECHQPGDYSHQSRQAFTPDCSDCHFEHRGQESLTLISDRSCVACHGNLEVQGGGTPAFAREITGFPEGHADFSVTLPDGRLPLAQAVERQADPGAVALNHALHLKPDLIAPEGRVQLVCADCHQPGPGPTGMRAVEYERHCQRCHGLEFDPDRPDERAPHAEPRLVRDRLLAVYGVDEGRMGSFRERRRISVRDSRATMGVTLSARVLAQVQEAENHLYRSACDKCHAMDLDARPFPTVAPAHFQTVWLPLSRFLHGDHVEIQGLTCEACHPRAAASRTTADVLIPGIEVCGGCHGGGAPPAEAELRAGGNDCADCHAYHPRQKGRKG